MLIVIQTNGVRKDLGNTKEGCNVDVHEILRRDAPLDDKRWKRKKDSVRLRVTLW